MSDNPFEGFVVINASDIGRTVICDFCNEDFTNSDALGGFIFQSKAVCPNCEPEFMKRVVKYHEEKFIRARNNIVNRVSFADFVRANR